MRIEKSETQIKRQIVIALEHLGYKVKRLHAGRVIYNMHNNHTGTLDLIAFGRNGETIFIETKKPGESLNPSQQAEAIDLVDRGFKIIVAWDIDSLMEGLKFKLKRNNK